MTMVTTGTKSRSRKSTRTSRRAATRTREIPARLNRRGRTTAAQKAYARRAQRTAAVEHAGGQAPAGLLAPVRLRLPKSRASFVLLMMSLLATGVVLTLWLTTQAIADSYRLDRVRAETAALTEKAERLQREVSREQTVAALDRKARQLGMVPSGDPARILVTPMGKKKLIGEPQAAKPATPPPSRSQSTSGGERNSDQGRASSTSSDERDSSSRQSSSGSRQDSRDSESSSSAQRGDSAREESTNTRRSQSDDRDEDSSGSSRRASSQSAGG